jgi:hypothetical protein
LTGVGRQLSLRLSDEPETAAVGEEGDQPAEPVNLNPTQDVAIQ